MKIFTVPYEFKHEEKIVGGYLSARQLIYLLLAGASLSILLLPITWFLKLPFALLFLIFFVLCAFITIDGIRLDTYLLLLAKFVFKDKKIKYER